MVFSSDLPDPLEKLQFFFHFSIVSLELIYFNRKSYKSLVFRMVYGRVIVASTTGDGSNRLDTAQVRNLDTGDTA